MKSLFLLLAVFAVHATNIEEKAVFSVPPGFNASNIIGITLGTNGHLRKRQLNTLTGRTLAPGQSLTIASSSKVNSVRNDFSTTFSVNHYVMSVDDYDLCVTNDYTNCRYFVAASCKTTSWCKQSMSLAIAEDLKVLIINPFNTLTTQFTGSINMSFVTLVNTTSEGPSTSNGNNPFKNLGATVIGVLIGGVVLAIVIITAICIHDCREIRRYRNPTGTGGKYNMQLSTSNLVGQQSISMAPLQNSASKNPPVSQSPTFARV
jgi:hypothetical protein